MSDSEEDLATIGRQKSIFSSMGRVKQINHLREKWSPKPKPPDRTDTPSPSSSPWGRRPSRDKFPSESSGERGRRSFQRAQSVSGSPSRSPSRSPRRQPVVSVVDMERYLAINSWLEHNDINVAQVANVRADQNVKGYGLFDDLYSSLEVLEIPLQSELSHLNYLDQYTGALCSKEEKTDELLSPALFDYLTVIGADMLDVKIHNFWNHRENMFEATVAFAHPAESQFNAESLEHFCFPAGIKSITVADSIDKRNDESVSLICKEGEFFVLMLSGGGVQGQSVQYAMCMKGTITICGGGDDGKNMLLPVCYCIVARIPLIPFFRAVLQGFLDNLRNEFELSPITGNNPLSCIVTDKHAGYIDDILQKLQMTPLPDKGLSVSVNVFPHPSPELDLTRPHKENDADERVALLLQWALPSLLSRLSIDCLLQILSLLLVEMKLIVVSEEIPLLSSATLGLASLLHPLTWAGPLISVLPLTMHEYMEAPVPLICGVDELPRDFECSKGTCILYIMENRVQLHLEDKCAFDKLQMPGLESLSCDLTRFTKKMLGHVAGSFRDNVLPLSTHLVIHRIHRHIEYLINVCSHPREQTLRQDADEQLDADETGFVDIFMQTQMYQKYQDDQPAASIIEQNNQPVLDVQDITDQVPMKTSSNNTQHDGLKSAVSVLFQIALAGVSTLPCSSSQANIAAEVCADTDVDTQSGDILELSILDEPEPGLVELSPAEFTPSARIFSIMKNSPNEKVESPNRVQELLSPTLSESSSNFEKRPGRTFVWPLSQSELDIFWVTDEASVASPGSTQRLAIQSPRSASFESPRRSPNNTSDISYGQDPKSGGRSDHGSVVNTQRADTETTISIFDTALSEALGSADTVDDSWLLEPFDDQRPTSEQDEDSDEDPFTKNESSVEVGFISIDELAKDLGPEKHHPRSTQQNIYGHDEGETAVHLLQDFKLDQRQIAVVTTGISVDSRGAWEGWCEGKLFVSEELGTLIWERHAIAFAALNMHIADITGIELEDIELISPNGLKQQRVRFTFGTEAICFQFASSSHHDEFFATSQKLIPSPHNTQVIERQDTAPSMSSALVVRPRLPTLVVQHHEEIGKPNDDKSTEISTVSTSPLQKVSDIDQFKRKLRRGILVEKHGSHGKPHAKFIFTDTHCSHIMWSKPPPGAGAGDHERLTNSDDQYHHRSSLFSQNKSIPVDSITAIITGKQTTVFRRAAANKSNDRVCLSILTPTRTLDICAYSVPGFKELYRGFSLLLEEIKRTRDGLD